MNRALRTAARWVATGFGLGLSPVIPGTVGSLPGVLLVWLTWPAGVPWQIFSAILLALVAVPFCEVAEREFGQKDDHRIVADEYMTFPLCMLGLPALPWMLAVAFVSHRLCDILKPPPARRLQLLPGGAGVVLDDVVSALYSLAVNHAIYAVALRSLPALRG